MGWQHGLIRQRRSRLSYGIFTYVLYNEQEHGPAEVVKPIRDQYEKDEFNIKAIDWLVRKVSIFDSCKRY